MDKIKISNLCLLVISVTTYLAIYVYWQTNCVVGNCAYDLRNNLLRPISDGSMYLSAILFGLFLIPSGYYKSWFKYVFSWGFPLAVYMTYITEGSSSIPAYGKIEVVRFWGIVFVAVTVLFVLIKYIRERKRNK